MQLNVSPTFCLCLTGFFFCCPVGLCLDEQILSVAQKKFLMRDYLGSERCLRQIMDKKSFGNESIQDRVFVINKLALCLDRQGRAKDGIVLHERALDLAKQSSRSFSESELLMLESNLANAYAKSKLFEKSIALMTKNLERRKKVFGSESIQLAVCYNNLGSAFQDVGNFAAAERNYVKALTILEKSSGNTDSRLYSTLQNLADLYRSQARYDDQLRIANQMVKNARDSHTKNSIVYADSLEILGKALKCKKNFKQSISTFTEAIEVKTKIMGENSNSVADSQNSLGCAYLENGDIELAIPHLEKAVEVFAVLNGPDSKDTMNASQNLRNAREALKKRAR